MGSNQFFSTETENLMSKKIARPFVVLAMLFVMLLIVVVYTLITLSFINKSLASLNIMWNLVYQTNWSGFTPEINELLRTAIAVLTLSILWYIFTDPKEKIRRRKTEGPDVIFQTNLQYSTER